MLEIKYMAVLVAAVVNFIIGFLMHGPIAGKTWMKLANIHPTGKEKFSDMLPQMGWNLLANIVAAYVIAMFYALFKYTPFYGAGGMGSGAIIAFWCWFGFAVTSSSMEVIWLGRSMKLWAFELGCSLISFLVMGAVIGAW